jgi:hypothetical protein
MLMVGFFSSRPLTYRVSALGAIARRRGGAHGLRGFGANLGVVAFDQRFRRQIPPGVGVCGRCPHAPRIAQLHHVAGHRLIAPVEIQLREIRAFEPHPHAKDVPRFVDALPADRDDGRCCEKVGLHLAARPSPARFPPIRGSSGARAGFPRGRLRPCR